MGCNKCKNKNKSNTKIDVNGEIENENNQSSVKKFLVFLTKILIFLIAGVILSIIVVPFSIYLLFKAIFLDARLDTTMMTNMLKMITTQKISS